MDSILVVTIKAISQPELSQIITATGGTWVLEPTLNQGTLVNGEATVFISPPHAPSVDYCTEEIIEFSEKAGAKPSSVICIDMGHGDGSDELARSVAESILTKWHGFLDGNGVFDDRWVLGE